MKKFSAIVAVAALSCASAVSSFAADQGATNFTGPLTANYNSSFILDLQRTTNSTAQLQLGNASNDYTFFVNSTIAGFKSNGNTPMVFSASGFLGDGTIAPLDQLHVHRSTAGPVGTRISNTDGFVVLTSDDQGLEVQTGSTDRNSAPEFSIDASGNGDIVGSFTVGTTMSAAVVEIRGSGNDLAESFKVNHAVDQVKAGMIVSIDPNNAGEMMLATTPYDFKVAGIINGAGGLHAGIHLGDTYEPGNGYHQVALTGRVYVKAVAINGAITPGDMLTTSSVPGHAMKVTDHSKAYGAVIGKAMSSIDPETGLVLVLVSLQ